MVFLLGFFVKQIVARWWSTWEAVPLPGSFHWDHSFIWNFYYWWYLGGRPFARFFSLGPFFYLEFLLLRVLGRPSLCQFCFFNCHQHHHHNIDHHLDLDQPSDPLSLICHSIVQKTPKGKRWAARINRYLVIIMIKMLSVLHTVHNECLTDGKIFIN